MKFSPLLLVASMGALSGTAFADLNEIQAHHIPNEYETVGGYTLGMNNSGVAATGGVSAIRVNPGMLPLEQQYGVVAGYFWPTSGRDFFHAGIVDTKTSSVSAGVSYTGFTKNYDFSDASSTEIDSPVKQRLSLAFAKSFSRISVGVAAHYVSAEEKDGFDIAKSDGVAAGIGVAGLMTQELRVGASVENLANKSVKNYAPTTIRAGGAYLFARGAASGHLDFRQRDRVPAFESDLPFYLRTGKNDDGFKEPERMLIASFSAKIYDAIRLLAAYGTSMTSEDDRQSLSGGIALVSKSVVINYNIAKPYMKEAKVQHGISVGVTMAM